MIHLDHKGFEKISGPTIEYIAKFIRGLAGPTEHSIAKDRAATFMKSKTYEKLEDRNK